MTEDEFRKQPSQDRPPNGSGLLTEQQADALYGLADPSDTFHPRNLCLTQEQAERIAKARQQKQEPGRRADAGKTRWDLLPFDALHAVAEVATHGAAEYAPRNWELGMSWSRMVGSLLRHLYARMRGEHCDPKSGLPHLAHAAWNALALCAYDLRGVGRNDLLEIAYGPEPPAAAVVQPGTAAPDPAG